MRHAAADLNDVWNGTSLGAAAFVVVDATPGLVIGPLNTGLY